MKKFVYMKAKKIVITGAAGLVGLNILSLIDSKKYKIFAIDKNLQRLKFAKKINPSIEIFCEDLAQNPKNWEKIFEETACVIQLQAQISHPNPYPYIRNNVTSVKNVLRVCKKYKIKNLIHISSSVVLSVAQDLYTKTKKEGENLVKKSHIPYTILRPPLMYGKFNDKHLEFIIKKFEKSFFVIFPGKGNYIRQPLYVKDLVKIIIKLIEKKSSQKIYNIIGKEKIYFINLLKLMFKAKNKYNIFIKLPLPFFLFLLKFYVFITRKKPFIPDQLKALTAGDLFPVEDWEKKFGVKYTPFKEAIKK